MHVLQQLCHQHTQEADEEGHKGPAHHAAAEAVDEREAEDAAEEVGDGGMERHEYLLAVSGVEDAEAEGQHAAHEVVTVAVHGLSLGIVEAQGELDAEADGHQRHRPSPVAAVEQKAVNDVELEHQTEEPVGAGPDDVVGIGQEVVEHSQHRHDVEQLVLVGARRDVVEHGERHETHNHHLEELQVVVADES